MMTSIMMFITGATGHVGSEIVSQLAAAGQPVRALVRDASGATLPTGVEPVAGDLNHVETWADGLKGVRGVFLLSGYNDMPGTLAAIKRAGVERVVLLSSQSAADSDTHNAVARYHILSEAAVRESGLPWTFLRPSSFMSNALRWLPLMREGKPIREAFGDARLAMVDPHDIAAVAIEALTSTDGKHAGKGYRLTGPEALNAEERVRVLSAVLNRPLRYEPMSDEEARADMIASSTPAPYIEAFFDLFRGGKYDESPVHPTVEQVTGRPPHTFEQWVRAHAEAFR
jgi:uncharacterized protein YbjT (DUF2867 family)